MGTLGEYGAGGVWETSEGGEMSRNTKKNVRGAQLPTPPVPHPPLKAK